MEFRTKIIDSCIDMRSYLLNWSFGKRIKIKVNNEEKMLSNILFPLLNDEDLWEAFNLLITISSQPRG